MMTINFKPKFHEPIHSLDTSMSWQEKKGIDRHDEEFMQEKNRLLAAGAMIYSFLPLQAEDTTEEKQDRAFKISSLIFGGFVFSYVMYIIISFFNEKHPHQAMHQLTLMSSICLIGCFALLILLFFIGWQFVKENKK